MRILGIDYGQKRIGLAISDETGTIAVPLQYVTGLAGVVELATQRGAKKIVVGVPVRLDGQPTQQTALTLQFIEKLRAATTVPIAKWDERLTSAQANRVLIEGNVSRRDRKENVDKLAAQLMLQSFLDATNLPTSGDEAP